MMPRQFWQCLKESNRTFVSEVMDENWQCVFKCEVRLMYVAVSLVVTAIVVAAGARMMRRKLRKKKA